MNNLQAILEKIVSHKAFVLPETPLSAAVLILLMQDDDERLFLIITKRPESIASYAGDYCFPGGMRDPSDLDLKMTAMREAEEELGLKLADYQVVNQLDDFYDRYDNVVRPFIAVITRVAFETCFKLSQDEVEAIYYFPLDDLHRLERNRVLEQMTRIEPTYSYTHDNVFIWGLTARIMVHLGNIIFDLNLPHGKKRV